MEFDLVTYKKKNENNENAIFFCDKQHNSSLFFSVWFHPRKLRLAVKKYTEGKKARKKMKKITKKKSIFVGFQLSP